MPIGAKNQIAIRMLCLEFYRERRSRHTFDQVMDLLDQTTREVMVIPGAREELEEDDVEEVLRRPGKYLGKAINELGEQELIDLVNRTLLTERLYLVYFPLPQLLSFPREYAVGKGVIIGYDSCPQPVQRFLSKVGSALIAQDEELELNSVDSLQLLKIQVSANGPIKAISKASRPADDALHVLRLEYGKDVNSPYVLTYADGEVMAKMNASKREDFLRYVPTHDEITTKLQHIILKEHPNDVEIRLRNAIRLFGMTTEASRPEIRFSLLMNSLEGLLMSESDKDSVTTRLAEKVAFLLEGKLEPRLSLCKKVKALYKLRSDFVHQSKDFQGVTDEDISELTVIFRGVFSRLLELESQGYESIQKRPAVKTVDGLVDDLKFG